MNVCYFPGCTLRTKAKELDLYARRCAEVLGITLQEPADWQCCGGVFSGASDEIASKLSAVRALCAARDQGQMLISACSACHHVLKRTNYAVQTDAVFADRVNRYLAPENPYAGETCVLHYLEMLRDVVGFSCIRDAVKNPLSGRRIGAY